MLIRVNELETGLKDNNNVNDIAVFKQEIKGYERWVICCDIENKIILEEIWKGISEEVAIDIQIGLEDIISRMNIYILYFVENIRDAMLKAKIENDKFSSRKIVIPKRMPDESELTTFVEQRLFLINVNCASPSDDKTLYQCFEEKDNKLFMLYQLGEKDYDKVLDRYMKEEGR